MTGSRDRRNGAEPGAAALLPGRRSSRRTNLCPPLTSCRMSVGLAFTAGSLRGFEGSSSESESGSSRRFWACSSMALRGQRARAEGEGWLCPAATRSSTVPVLPALRCSSTAAIGQQQPRAQLLGLSHLQAVPKGCSAVTRSLTQLQTLCLSLSPRARPCWQPTPPQQTHQPPTSVFLSPPQRLQQDNPPSTSSQPSALRPAHTAPPNSHPSGTALPPHSHQGAEQTAGQDVALPLRAGLTPVATLPARSLHLLLILLLLPALPLLLVFLVLLQHGLKVNVCLALVELLQLL